VTAFFFERAGMAELMPPIAVFAFNRPDHLQRTLDALAANVGAAAASLVVFCDGPRSEADASSCEQVVQVARQARGFATLDIVVRERNFGCGGSVIDGVSTMLRNHTSIIVIEDDILTSPFTLDYLRRALDKYVSHPSVFSIAAWAPPFPVTEPTYPYNSFFFPRFHCWGWATWRDRWQLNEWSFPKYDDYVAYPFLRAAHRRGGVDLPILLQSQVEGKIDSWAARVEYTRFLNGGLTLYPRHSHVLNIGMDGSGRHCGKSTKYGTALSQHKSRDAAPFPCHVCVDDRIASRVRRIYRPPSLVRRLASKMSRMIQARLRLP